MKEQLIIALTSWQKRISNIPVVIDSILAQTIQPDKIVLTLSEDEFTNRVIPADIQSYIDSHKQIQLNWVKENTRVWKKFLPLLSVYPNALIIPIDDDRLYPPTMIEDFMQAHAKYPDRPISGNRYVYKGIKAHCGCASLVQAKFFEGWEQYVTPEFRTACPSSDLFYTYLASKNGYFYAESSCDYFAPQYAYNENDSYSLTLPKRPLQTSQAAIYHAFGMEVKRLFTDDDHKPYCVLGSAQTELGKKIEEEMLTWLVPYFNVYLIRHDGSTYEYAALKWMKDVMGRTNEPCFYLHTKGAYFTRQVTHRVHNMWRREFTTRQSEYLKAVDTDKPTMACPYTGSTHVPWYNGWVANAAAIRQMPIIRTDDRFYYEQGGLFDEADAVGLRMNDTTMENRGPMHIDLRIQFN